jgi:L-lactate utilization protein LutC
MSYAVPATSQEIERTMGAVAARGIAAELVGTKAEALARLQELIPPGASVSAGASLSLKEIGFEELLISKNHPWRNLKDEIVAEKDPARATLLRRQATLADYFLGSVHAVAQTGQLVIASMSGSQLAPYAYSSGHIIWVVGTQKIAANLDDAIRRVREYVLPHEDKRMRELTAGKMGSMIGKLLIIEQEAPFLGRKLTLLFVNEVVGD